MTTGHVHSFIWDGSPSSGVRCSQRAAEKHQRILQRNGFIWLEKGITYKSVHQLSDSSSLGTSFFRRTEAKDISWICPTMFITCCLSSCSPQPMVNELDASMCDYHISLLHSTGHAEFLHRTTLHLQMRVEKHYLHYFKKPTDLCSKERSQRS